MSSCSSAKWRLSENFFVTDGKNSLDHLYYSPRSEQTGSISPSTRATWKTCVRYELCQLRLNNVMTMILFYTPDVLRSLCLTGWDFSDMCWEHEKSLLGLIVFNVCRIHCLPKLFEIMGSWFCRVILLFHIYRQYTLDSNYSVPYKQLESKSDLYIFFPVYVTMPF